MKKPTIEPTPNGPYRATGLTHVRDSDGPMDVAEEVYLCRCGGSKKKPYCDGTHAKNGFTDAIESDRVPNKLEKYVGKEMSLSDNRGICAHAGVCTSGLPSVFRLKKEPFVDADGGGSPDEIRQIVGKCPSGALAVEPASPAGEPSIFIAPNGPYAVRGPVELKGAKWLDGADRSRFTLCRCGGSKNKPFCNGEHWNRKFDEKAQG